MAFDTIMKEMDLLVLDENIINITPSPDHLRNILKDKPFATLVCRHMLNLRIKKSTAIANFSKAENLLPSLHSVMLQNADITALKESVRFN